MVLDYTGEPKVATPYALHNKTTGQKAPEGRWTRTLVCRVSVMAVAGMLRQGLAGGHLQQVRDQIGKTPPLLIRTLLRVLMKLPVGGEGDPGWLAAQQVCGVCGKADGRACRA